MFSININSKNTGFTLIELLVVVAIIGVLSSVVISSLSSARSKARDTKRISDVRQIQNTLEIYFADNGYYPEATILGTRCNTNLPTATPAGSNSLSVLKSLSFLKEIPIDPLNTSGSPSYCYEYIGLGSRSSFPSASSLYCAGYRRTDFLYVLTFSLENPRSIFSQVTNSTTATHCIHGPLK